MSGLIDQHPSWWMIPVYGVVIVLVVGAVLTALTLAGRVVVRWVDRRLERAEFQRNVYPETPVHSPAPDLGRLTVRSRQVLSDDAGARVGEQATPSPLHGCADGVAPYTAADLSSTPELVRSAVSKPATTSANPWRNAGSAAWTR